MPIPREPRPSWPRTPTRSARYRGWSVGRSAWNIAWSESRLDCRSAPLAWLGATFDETLTIGMPEVLWQASSLGRAGAIAQLTWPRLATRVASGVELPLARALVDHLLGFERLSAEPRLQITPVE